MSISKLSVNLNSVLKSLHRDTRGRINFHPYANYSLIFNMIALLATVSLQGHASIYILKEHVLGFMMCFCHHQKIVTMTLTSPPNKITHRPAHTHRGSITPSQCSKCLLWTAPTIATMPTTGRQSPQVLRY